MSTINKIYDKDFRQKLMADPKKYYKEFGDTLLDDVEVVVKENTKEITYIVVPNTVSPDFLDQIQAGDSTHSVGTILTLSTGYCVTSTLSTLTTAGSAGTLSTAPP